MVAQHLSANVYHIVFVSIRQIVVSCPEQQPPGAEQGAVVVGNSGLGITLLAGHVGAGVYVVCVAGLGGVVVDAVVEDLPCLFDVAGRNCIGCSCLPRFYARPAGRISKTPLGPFVHPLFV